MSETPRMIPPSLIGFDAAQDCTLIIARAVMVGVAWIGRYYSWNAAKNLSHSEARAIMDAGLDIVSIWEARGNLPAAFTEANGLREGRAAIALALACGQPLDTAIYFAVDFDATEAQIDARLIPYFHAVNEVLSGHYKVGAYGSGLVLSRLDALGLISFGFLAGAMGWQGSRAYANAHLTEIEQSVDVDPWGFGFSIDRDTAPAGRDFGSWHPPASTSAPVPVPMPVSPIDSIIAAPDFRQAVRLFQSQNGLNPDGLIGPLTLKTLRDKEKQL